MELDPAVIRRHLCAAADATTVDAQGKAYEALAAYLFDCIPGCFTERDLISFFGAEQIDVAVGNYRLPDGLAVLPAVVLVECKDWGRPVDTRTLGCFINILANRGVEAGILIAANGITGDPAELTNAHALGVGAMARGIKVLILTNVDIEGLSCTADLAELLNRRYLRAIASGGLGVPDTAAPPKQLGP
jgi:hypothetical protein